MPHADDSKIPRRKETLSLNLFPRVWTFALESLGAAPGLPFGPAPATQSFTSRPSLLDNLFCSAFRSAHDCGVDNLLADPRHRRREWAAGLPPGRQAIQDVFHRVPR